MGRQLTIKGLTDRGLTDRGLIGLAAVALCVAPVLSPCVAGVQATPEAPPGPREPAPDVFRPREVPEELDTTWRKTTGSGHFQASIKSMSRPPKINELHNWTLRVLRPDGSAVVGARIEFDGGMPAHNHGFPTRPRVTRYLGMGTYLLEGVKFNMSGWWRFEFTIADGEVRDRVRFNVVIED